MKSSIYLDYAATTPIVQCARDAAKKYMTVYYNPSAAYGNAREVRADIENARATIAKCVGADPEEIYFTSGATEGNNIIIQGVLKSLGGRLVTSNIEHHSVLNLVSNTSYLLRANMLGYVDPDDLRGAIDDTDLVSVMLLNNEIGTIQPIKQLSDIAKKSNTYIHSDITQAVGHIPVNVHELGLDFATASGHKFGALKGIGFMYIRKGVKIPPLVYGGGQERGLRSGTENVPGIMSMAAALEYEMNHLGENLKHITEIQKYLCSQLEEVLIEYNWTYNNPLADHYAGNCNICFKGYRSEEIVEFLSNNMIYVSAGSACNTQDGKPSHVLKAIGLTDEEAESSIRISFGEKTTKEEIDALIMSLATYFKLRGGDDN
jgi:cysteine desulfurase